MRYGRLLAAEAKQRTALSVIEQNVVLTMNVHADAVLLKNAAHLLSAADVVHIQFTEAIWGSDSHRFRTLWTFLQHCRCPVVVTIHDTEPVLHDEKFNKRILKQVFLQLSKRIKRKGCQWLHLAGFMPTYTVTHHAIRHWLIEQTEFSFVCTEEEKHRLHLPHPLCRKVRRIPHFIEERPSLPSREAARTALGFDDQPVISLLGFIYGGKGYEILLDAVALLARPEVVVVFAGGVIPGNEAYLEHLKTRASSLGIDRQLRITGYLPEDDLERYLVATDIPVCPYEKCYASSSLSSWISANRQILTSDLPQFREYQTLEPDALHFFSPYTAEAFAASLKKLLSKDGVNHKVLRLHEKLSMRVIFDEHLHYYSLIARQRAPLER